ncbi:28222_t:CDS:2, partial [Dentiscutata erythropus]
MDNLPFFGANNVSFINIDMDNNETFSDIIDYSNTENNNNNNERVIDVDNDETFSDIIDYSNKEKNNNNNERVIEAYESDLESEYEESAGTKYTLTENQSFGTWKSVDKHNTENSEFAGMDKNYTSHENISRHCGVCGQVGHNACTCISQDKNIDYEADADKNFNNNNNKIIA